MDNNAMKVCHGGRNLQHLAILHPASLPFSFSKSALEEYLQSWTLKRMERIFSIARIQYDDRPTYLSLLEFLVSSACVANLEENYIPT